MEHIRKLLDRVSVEQIKIELLNTAYGNADTLLARLDPRTLFGWYLCYGIVPWFIHSETILLGMLIFVIITTMMSRVSPLILFILGMGLLSQAGYLLVASWLFGGNWDAILPLLSLTMKLSIISLASVTAFCSMDPERLSDGLLRIGAPSHVSFAISYGYRMLPNLMEEYHHIFLSFRLRGRAPVKSGFLYWRLAMYFIRIAVISFYPLLLSTAKRSRTTVEALETRGFSYAGHDAAVKKIKLAYLKLSARDYAFLTIAALYTGMLFRLSA
jgi:energy-coupling factor transport system permease protein